jgi:endoglucanase
LADGYVAVIASSPYGIAMQNSDFYWGSNGNAANQIMALQMGYFVTNDNSYLKAALNNLDYILGRNPTGYCFMTGQGKKSPMFPHHRPSAADGIVAPIPGFMVGGPQPDHSADGCAGYPSAYPAKSYLDSQCSYSTNEVAINWNAPLAYGSTAMEFLSSRINSGALTGLNLSKAIDADQFFVYPNPADHSVKLNVGNQVILTYEIADITGRQVVSGNGFTANTLEVNIASLNSGLYIIKVLTSDKSYSTRFIKQ